MPLENSFRPGSRSALPRVRDRVKPLTPPRPSQIRHQIGLSISRSEDTHVQL